MPSAFSCVLMLLFPYVIVCFVMHHILSKHVSAQKLHLRLGVCACINEPLRAHMNTYACLEAREMRDMNFFWGTQHLLKCCAHFFGALCRAFIIFGVRCHVRIFLWGICIENHGFNVGITLFRLGTRMGPAIKINLTWFGHNSAWVTTQVSNHGMI